MTTKIVFNDQGFKDVLLSDGCKELIKSNADQIAKRAGDGYVVDGPMVGYNGTRWIAFVRTDGIEAMIDEAENKTLSKAVK